VLATLMVNLMLFSRVLMCAAGEFQCVQSHETNTE